MLADELQGRIAALPAIASIKIPGLPAPQASERVAALRQHLPLALRLALAAMRGHCRVAGRLRSWYSVCGGLFPRFSLALVRAIRSGDVAQTAALNEQLAPMAML